MPLPLVAIVGRPNVGKSSLLNMLVGRRVSIVDPTAGVTRDRIQAVCEHDGLFFELVDTGGYGIVDRDDLQEEVEAQIRVAVEQAALILFVVDARDGMLPLDQAVGGWLRGCGRPVRLLANKADSDDMTLELGDFHKLGFGAPLPISALHRRGENDIKDWIVEHLGEKNGTGTFCAEHPDDRSGKTYLSRFSPPDEPVMKIALVGRRNVGKSTFINALAGQQRVIVSEIPGTTRDAVDVRFDADGHTYVAIDTAGIRKKGRIADDVEFYSFHRAELSIRRADVVLFLMDATAEVSHVDKRLGSYIAGHFKPCILVVNKWDLAKSRASTDDYGDYLLHQLPGLDYAPVAFTTATQDRNVKSVIDLAAALFKQSRTRAPTSQINAVLIDVMEQSSSKPKRGRGAVKALYATQVSTGPPTIVVFVNHPQRLDDNFERFLVNRLREQLPFAEVPIRILFRSRRGRTFRGTD